MLTRLVLTALVAAALAAPAAHAVEPQKVRVLACEQATGDSGGSVKYAARMRAVPDTSRMALRLSLVERFVNGRWHRVRTDELDVWRTSKAGAAAFRFRQRVRGLRNGAVYRAIVHYRWYSASGDVIRRGRERSRACRQRGLPNLRVGRIGLEPGEVDGTYGYRVRIVNRGAASAQNVGVLLRVDGEVVDDSETIDVLKPGESRTVTFNGPACRRRLRVVVDPRDLIAESREFDNVRRATCL